MSGWGGSTKPAAWNDGGDTGDHGGDFGAGDDTSHLNGGISGFHVQDEFDTPADGAQGGGGGGGGGGFGACFNCGQDGHSKADCTNPRVMKCNHCNEEGHMIRDCPTAPPQEFTGECRICAKEGHRAADCPDKPPMMCNNCQEEGHSAAECESARKLDRSDVETVDADVAWEKICEATKEHDMDDVKEAVQQYIKACPQTTYPELEAAFRNQEIDLYLIALEKPSMISTLTNMDFQGNLGKKYSVTYRFDPKPARPREAEGWPTPEDNIERLADAGEVVNSGLSKCTNCDGLGHISKNCTEPKMEKEQVMITCYNCNETGHRVRDCSTPRVDKFACKNCGKSGHQVKECPEPRQAGPDVECRKCNEMGHYSSDCPQGGGSRGCYNCGQEGHSSKDCTEEKKIMCRNCDKEGHTSRECTEPKDMSKVQCRNCDAFGHESRGCPKPRDYSRVKCSNCNEMGHTKVRCKKEPAPLDDGFGTGGGGDDFGAGGGGAEAGFDAGPVNDDWMAEAAANSAPAGDAGWSGGGEVAW
ncbi:Uu.00g101580.m01.CDS01 [Anthostomella pinea]|uniref:Uu.00g101580.m01.CDS01 n=1 Tax=Anthostomella pinea TaxID=933095 RepID=A0AAI8V844_9PEZI|nr:Uu.00g101580.m01.CDS01 [Anthostomella pinea]